MLFLVSVMTGGTAVMGEWRTLPPFGTLKADSFSCFIDLPSRRTPQEFGFFVPSSVCSQLRGHFSTPRCFICHRESLKADADDQCTVGKIRKYLGPTCPPSERSCSVLVLRFTLGYGRYDGAQNSCRWSESGKPYAFLRSGETNGYLQCTR
jgi:hypothetical protein